MSITIVVPKEGAPEERVAMVPSLVAKITSLAALKIQKDAGKGINALDVAYKNVPVVNSSEELFATGDLVIKVLPPTEQEVAQMKNGAVLLSFLYPHLHPAVIKKLCEKQITSFAMELVPRISRAQSMDALSSQATIAGYKAVLIAASAAKFFFPMLTTAAGSVRPAKVLIIGAGVAGLQAIATARRLGAMVEAYDVRAEAKEQVESLGAKFVQTGIQAAGTGGYARELTEEEKNQQKEILKKHIANSNVVITTAGVPGRPAPKIITKDMVEAMQPGSVIVDIMAEMGGNCEFAKAGQTIEHNQVAIIGTANIYSSLANHASEMYARNILNFLELIVQKGELKIDWQDEILKDSVVTRDGQVVNERVKKQLGV